MFRGKYASAMNHYRNTAEVVKQNKSTVYIAFYFILKDHFHMFVQYLIYSVMFKYDTPDLMKPVTYYSGDAACIISVACAVLL